MKTMCRLLGMFEGLLRAMGNRFIKPSPKETANIKVTSKLAKLKCDLLSLKVCLLMQCT
jgi:hypothetical protein